MAAALSPEIEVAIIGAGAMGSGIAQVAAVAGHRVRLFDVAPEVAAQACKRIGEGLDKLVARGKLDAATAQATGKRIVPESALQQCARVGLVVEAIVEKLDAKRDLFGRLENVVARDCILASNTSSLSITAIAAGLQRPERVVGMHFFNPAVLMPLVEVVSGLATARDVADTVHATAAAWGKQPVHAKSTPGFIVNRVARPYYAEALRLLTERAADPATIDALMRDAGGFRMGPFELMDLIGNDVNFAVTHSVWSAYFHDPRYTPSLAQQELVAAGRLGRKSGRGFYEYGEGSAKPEPAIESPRPKPCQVTACGDLGHASALPERIRAGGVAISKAPALTAFPDGALRIASTLLFPTDGAPATARAAASGERDLVVFDLALDYATSPRLAVARADSCSDAAYDAAVGALQAAGVAASRLDDVPGLAVMRTVAMLANEAADAVNQGVASAAEIDLAMRLGVNYPRGPLAWAEAIGLDRIVRVLENLGASYGEDRYRVSPLLKRRLAAGARLDG